MMDQSEVFIWIHDSVELVGRGMLLANHSSGDKREDDDSKEWVLTGHEPITTPVTSEIINDDRGCYSPNHEPITTQVTNKMTSDSR